LTSRATRCYIPFSMPRQSQPRYDPTRNQWILRYQGRRHYLCSGRGSYVKAMRRAADVMGGVRVGNVETVAELIEAWLAGHGNEWDRMQPEGWYRYAGSTALANLQGDHLAGYLAWLQRCRYLPRAYLKGATEKTRAASGTPLCRHRLGRPYAARSVRAKFNAAWRVLRWAHQQRRHGGRLVEYLPERPKCPASARRPRDYPRDVLGVLFADRATLEARFGDELPFYPLHRQTRAILLWILETGCRPSEACRLRWADVKADHAELASTRRRPPGMCDGCRSRRRPG